MQQILGIAAISGSPGDLPQEIAPQLPTDWYVGHVSLPVIFPPAIYTIKPRSSAATKKFFSVALR
jgi:hypothetical protein